MYSILIFACPGVHCKWPACDVDERRKLHVSSVSLSAAVAVMAGLKRYLHQTQKVFASDSKGIHQTQEVFASNSKGICIRLNRYLHQTQQVFASDSEGIDIRLKRYLHQTQKVFASD